MLKGDYYNYEKNANQNGKVRVIRDNSERYTVILRQTLMLCRKEREEELYRGHEQIRNSVQLERWPVPIIFLASDSSVKFHNFLVEKRDANAHRSNYLASSRNDDPAWSFLHFY